MVEMHKPVRLSRLLRRHDPMVVALQRFCDANNTWLRVVDADGSTVLECGRSNGAGEAKDVSINVESHVIGSVVGPAAFIAAPCIEAIASEANLGRATGAEVLQLYRRQRVMVGLAELLSETSEPEVVADMVADAIARAMPDASVAFVDDGGRVLAASGAPKGGFDRTVRPGETVIMNDDDRCVLLAPLIGSERRFGHLQVVRDAEFTATDADLLSTLSVIAASSIGRAVANQRELERARSRSEDLEATVEQLQNELDLISTTVLASILFTDLVDSTRSQSAIGDENWARLIETHNRKSAALIDAHGGTLVDFAGDGFFAWFDTPSKAVECGRNHLAMVQELGLAARAGVHVGEAQQRGAGLSGITVNIAARIMSNAAEGQLLASGVTAQLLDGGDHQFEWSRDAEFKGIPGSWAVHSLVVQEPAS